MRPARPPKCTHVDAAKCECQSASKGFGRFRFTTGAEHCQFTRSIENSNFERDQRVWSRPREQLGYGDGLGQSLTLLPAAYINCSSAA